MRRLELPLLVALLLCTLAAPACKSKKRRPPLEQTTSKNGLSSMLQVADPQVNLQLLKGFYDVEGGSWRWTARSFSAALRVPKNASRNGATLVLKFVIPDVLIQKLNSIQLSANVNGVALPPQEYSRPGDYTYSRDVPAAAFPADAVRVDFSLDKTLPPTPSDKRELGVIVSAIGFEAK